MGHMSDPGLDLFALETLLGDMEALAHTARTGPSPRDREEAMAHIRTQYDKLARYLAPPKPIPVCPDTFHKDSDDNEFMEVAR